MCEHFVARAAEPFRLDVLWPFTERLERYGIAGFGWGVAWTDGAGALHCHRALGAFRDDPARTTLGRIETRSLLVHLRRPSKLSTMTITDTQPFDDPRGRFAFSHNGDLRDHRPWRQRFQAEGRIQGRADTEVAARWLEDRWPARGGGATSGALLAELHSSFGGQANLAVLETGGWVVHYAGNTENPVFSFRIGPIGVVSTGVYSIDRSLFRLVAANATERHLVRPGGAVALNRDGIAVAAS